MRRSPSLPLPADSAAAPARGGLPRSDWQTIASLLPYLWQYRGRVAIALAALVAAKLANVGVPLVLKDIVDALDLKPGDPRAVLAVPVALLVAYGLLRIGVTVFTELREVVFARVTQDVTRIVGLKVFRHLFGLSLRFHLDRQTGGMSRDLERGARGINSLVSYTLYSILPTLLEIALVVGILVVRYDAWFAVIAVGALALYVVWTVKVTEWRTAFRRQVNEEDSKANTRAIDALLNYETVKYFGNEEHEARRYDVNLQSLMRASIRSQNTLSLLNLGQATIIATAVTLLVWRATEGVVAGRMTLGDLVLVNAFMIQLYIPLNFLGVLYREIKQSLTDLEKMFRLLDEHREVDDAPGARPLPPAAPGGARLRFEQVDFAYDARRPILQSVDFTVEPGTTTAVVGPSGAGKSTLSRLLYRFYDVAGGRITIDGHDIRAVTQASLRAAVGIVPQDTVLFNDTLRYNVAYGRIGASDAEIEAAARAAQLSDFVARLPEGWNTMVGERGLKLSGGEKQRVAIARMLLKNPPILILDEATSALDTANEQAIQGALRAVAADRTALVIAHRLSTVVDADQILVMEGGRIVERGRHEALLAAGGAYARMWALQAVADEAHPDEGGAPPPPAGPGVP